MMGPNVPNHPGQCPKLSSESTYMLVLKCSAPIAMSVSLQKPWLDTHLPLATLTISRY
jgi:hypothetical protein